MPLNIFRQKRQIRKSDTYDDTLPAGTALETGSTDLETDNNALRSQIRRLWAADGSLPWTSDNPEIDSVKYGIKELAEAIDAEVDINEAIDSFVPTTSQTVFSLSQIPINPNAPLINIRGQKLNSGADFNISGTTLTLLIDYILDSNDILYAQYKYQS